LRQPKSLLIVNSNHFKGCSDDSGSSLKTIFLVVPFDFKLGLIPFSFKYHYEKQFEGDHTIEDTNSIPDYMQFT